MEEGIPPSHKGWKVTKIYLAGPITGITFGEATDWREDAKRFLDSPTVRTFSPLRGKDYLKDKGELHSGTYDGTLTSQKGIMGRDYFDCTSSTVVIFNFLGAKKASIGTAMELAWCYQKQIPTVVIMEKEGNIHDHVMVREAITYRVETLGEAVAVTKMLLNEI